jgi:hypothetical protein
MDILAHALWVGAGVALARRRWNISTPTAVGTVVLATLPDAFQLLPIAGWWIFADGPLAAVWAHAVAGPGQEPTLAPMVGFWSHHLHCVAHSAPIAGAVTLLAWAIWHSLWIPLLGWWSHILIDVFTHSADFYPSPVLYPITQRGFDGFAWNTPWFMVLNYTALGLTGLGLWLLRSDKLH